jgi:hypothetical protein
VEFQATRLPTKKNKKKIRGYQPPKIKEN